MQGALGKEPFCVLTGCSLIFLVDRHYSGENKECRRVGLGGNDGFILIFSYNLIFLQLAGQDTSLGVFLAGRFLL